MKKLSSEIISLVHHVKLNEAGWWEKVIRNLIKTIFGNRNNGPTTFEVVEAELRNSLGHKINKERLRKEFDTLVSSKELIKFNGKHYILSDTAFKDFKNLTYDQSKVEVNARERFIKILRDEIPEMHGEKLWDSFNNKLIIPLVREIGARTYELISGKRSLKLEQYDQFHKFINDYADNRTRLTRAISSFFNFQDKCIRSFILRQLSAYFFLESTNLDTKTIEKVYSISKSQTRLKVFVDTNFLLTLLDLHDNPSNEATETLLELLEETKNKVEVKFYVFPITIREFQNLIGKFKSYLARTKPTLGYARAVENSNEFSGILKKYFEKCIQNNSVIDPEDYFDPYLNNFTVLLRSKGVELQQENIEDKYAKDQRVIDDQHDQVDHRFKKLKNRPEYIRLSRQELELEKNKIWDKFKHDCRLWHAVFDKRPAYLDSPKDAKNWIITLDFSFISYDRFKYKMGKGSNFGICIHPNELISMLQFWVPRTEKFEKAILENFKLPFLFKEFDVEAEKISMEILSALSMYEESRDMQDDVVSEILMNNAIRQKIKPSKSVEENAELIREEILKRYEETKKKLHSKEKQNIELVTKVAELENKLEGINRKIDDTNEKQLLRISERFNELLNRQMNEFEKEAEKLKYEIQVLKERKRDMLELKEKAEHDFKLETKKLSFQLSCLMYGKAKVIAKKRAKIDRKYYNKEKLEAIGTKIDDLTTNLTKINKLLADVDDTVIVVCENQNSKYFNMLGFDNVKFVPENNSAGVFYKVISNRNYIGLRDRDFLMESEIKILQEKYPNYKILDYYCFENYLYHPDNLKEATNLYGVSRFNYEEYIRQILSQRSIKRDSVISKIDSARKGYQEFKANAEGVSREKNVIHDITKLLDSENIEDVLKVYSLKDAKYFDKSFMEAYNLDTVKLISTNWFKEQISRVILS
jgi:hypothetical protein